MVRFFWLFIFLGLSALAEETDTVTFFMQLSKPQFFQGEQLVAQFIVESPKERVIEVEVVKFPEFRGFWSENTILRQGPVPISILGNRTGKAQAIVGSYNLSSMVGFHNPTIEPMIILVKGVGPTPQTFTSNRLDISPLPLPDIPANLKKYPFSGAVGRFSASLERTEIPFRKGQPFLIRAQLLGEGNFQEINQIPIVFPTDFHLVSQTASNDSMAGRMRKLFDWVFTIDSVAPQEVELPGFLYFDPFQKKYEPVSFPSLHFVSIPEAKLPETKLNLHSFSLGTENTWTAYTPLGERKLFWMLQILGAAALLAQVLGNQIKQRKRLREKDPKYQKLLKKKLAHQALKKKDWSVFLPLAAELARARLNELKTNPTPSVPSLKLLIEVDNGLRFSHHKSLTVSVEDLMKTWDAVYDDLVPPTSRV